MDQVDEGPMKCNNKINKVPRNFPFDRNHYLCGGHFLFNDFLISNCHSCLGHMVMDNYWGQNSMSPFCWVCIQSLLLRSWTVLLLEADFYQASPSMVSAYARLPPKKFAHQSYWISWVVTTTTMLFPLPRGTLFWLIVDYMSLGWVPIVESFFCNLRLNRTTMWKKLELEIHLTHAN